MPINSVKPTVGGQQLQKSEFFKKPVNSGDFKKALENAKDQKLDPALNVEKAKPQAELKFSNHAVERMRARGIHYSPQEMTSIREAVADAKEKGAKETLVLNDKSAMIVSVENETVVTVMDKGALKNNLFTNIDSTVLI